MEKFLTRMPWRRAARKWPDSWMKMMKPRRKMPAPVLAMVVRGARESKEAVGAVDVGW